MAKSTAEVTLSHPWNGHEVGERVELDAAIARRVVRSGHGVYSTMADAVRVGGETAAESTVAAVKASAAKSKK